MQRFTSLRSFYDIYQLVIAVIGMVAIIRILCCLPWANSIGYGIVTVAGYWGGQSIVTLLKKKLNASL